MNWLAILLALAGIGGAPATKAEPTKRQQCKSASAKQACKPATKPKKKRVAKPRPAPTATPAPGSGGGTDAPAATKPEATPTPAPRKPPGPGATPTPVATATPVPTATPVAYPRRTSVDLLEWDVRSSYHTLGAGRVTFNANNLGEDDHDLAVRAGDGPPLGKLALAPRENGPLALELAAGSYILYCSLPDHEEAGMRLVISVR